LIFFRIFKSRRVKLATFCIFFKIYFLFSYWAFVIKVCLNGASCAVGFLAERRFCADAFNLATGNGAENFRFVVVAGNLPSPDRAVAAEERPFFALSVVVKKTNAVLASFSFFDL
jgi:hypothetical protein